jgi:hypothetical protein
MYKGNQKKKLNFKVLKIDCLLEIIIIAHILLINSLNNEYQSEDSFFF